MKRKMVKQYLQNCIEDIVFEDSVLKNESQRILAKDVRQLAVQVAIDNHKGGDDEEIYVLRCPSPYTATRVNRLQKKTRDIKFQGSIDNCSKYRPGMTMAVKIFLV